MTAGPFIDCDNLDEAIDQYTKHLGYRLDMLMPADEPREAIVSKNGEALRLMSVPPAVAGGSTVRENHPAAEAAPLLRKEGSLEKPPKGGTQNSWITGRAGMEYRDLIPDRVGGKVIASHIRITKGGEVPDYVHYHKVRFQMIYCKAGWVRVVYEDQGPPFVLNAGDCVLQPPEIRHRVLESSAGAEVLEVSAPAEHQTWVEHELELPTSELKPDRIFDGQRFVLHRGDSMASDEACAITETEIEEATQGYSSVRMVRLAAGAVYSPERFGEFVFLYVLSGNIQPQSSNLSFHTDEHVAFTHRTDSLGVTAFEDSEILEVRLREI